jgi:hypothetical protein
VEQAVLPYQHVCGLNRSAASMDGRSDFISPEGLRVDGRRPAEVRVPPCSVSAASRVLRRTSTEADTGVVVRDTVPAARSAVQDVARVHR